MGEKEREIAKKDEDIKVLNARFQLADQKYNALWNLQGWSADDIWECNYCTFPFLPSEGGTMGCAECGEPFCPDCCAPEEETRKAEEDIHCKQCWAKRDNN